MAAARRSAEATEELRSSLVTMAQRLVDRDGPAALTMRALAGEADCAVGLIYKVFAHREELVTQVIHADLTRLSGELEGLVGAAGTRTIAANLGRYADLLLESPSIGLTHEIAHDPQAVAAVDAAPSTTRLVGALETTVADYLAAEQQRGRVDADVDVRAFGFVIAGAVHNLLMSGDPYPRPSRRRLKHMLAAVADRLAPATAPATPRKPATTRTTRAGGKP
jgi:AcrR family transcriptional regulator